MATIKQSLEDLLTLDGALCAAVVDASSGMMLGSMGTGVDLEVAAAGNGSGVAATRAAVCGGRGLKRAGRGGRQQT